jgi:hypothetical protein
MSKMGKKIANLTSLNLAMIERKSVIVPTYKSWENPKPASFLMGLSGVILMELFKAGMYEYTKQGKPDEAK